MTAPKPTPARLLRMAEAIPETTENYSVRRELIRTLKDLVALEDVAA